MSKEEKMVIYKRGGSQTVWGVPCETMTINKKDFSNYKKDGWLNKAADLKEQKTLAPSK